MTGFLFCEGIFLKFVSKIISILLPFLGVHEALHFRECSPSFQGVLKKELFVASFVEIGSVVLQMLTKGPVLIRKPHWNNIAKVNG